MNIRNLKVREEHRDYTKKNQNNYKNETVGFILLKGSWLEKAGFTINTPVSVVVNKNCLLIIPKEN